MLRSLAILNFHDIGENGYPVLLFESVLNGLHKKGYNCIDLMHATKLLSEGKTLPENAFALTFDDGYLSTLTVAAPLLLELNFQATVFPIAASRSMKDGRSTFENKPLLTENELRDLKQSGFVIGSHTMTHPNLTKLDYNDVVRELDDSKDRLQQQTDGPVDCFAYPYGRYSKTVRIAVSERFYCACGTNLALTNEHTDRFSLNRIDMAMFDRKALIPLITQRAFPIYLFARRLLLNVQQRNLEYG